MATKKSVKPDAETVAQAQIDDLAGAPDEFDTAAEETEAYVEPYYIKLLVYGMPGAGKTTLAGSGVEDPRLSPGLMLDFEGGDVAIRSKIQRITMAQLKDPEFLPPEDKLCVIRIRTWKDFEDVYATLAAEPDLFKTVVLDSLSEMGYMCLQTAMNPTSQASRLAPREIFSFDAPEQRHYLVSGGAVKKLVRAFRDLPLHTIFVCGVQETPNPKTKINQRLPALTGKLAFEIPGLVTIVGYLDTEEWADPESTDSSVSIERVLDVTPSDKWACKDRSEGGKLGGYVVGPTLPKILDLLLTEE